jgi:hypothetical protein
VAFVVAVFVSNVPQGTAATLALSRTGTSNRTIATMWEWLTVASAAVAAGGFLVADHIPDQGLYAQAFAGWRRRGHARELDDPASSGVGGSTSAATRKPRLSVELSGSLPLRADTR